MLIECTFCKATAQFPDSKEGSKVKCGECGKVYVAREKGAKPSKVSPTPFVIGGAVLVAILVVFFLVNSNKQPAQAPVVKAAPPPEEPKIDRTGWNSELVKVVREVYEAAFQLNTIKIAGMLDIPRIVERLKATPERESMLAYSDMTTGDRQAVADEIIEHFTKGEGELAIAHWKPFEGSVEAEGDTESVVRVKVGGRDEANMATTLTIEWKLAKDKDGKWKLYDWSRYISEQEKKAKSSLKAKGIEKVKLDDGTSLYQAELRPLPHLDDTPPELRTRIDDLAARMIDFKLKPKENRAAQNELVEIGKPAIPILLTKMYETKIVDDDSKSKVGVLNLALRDITGYDPGFSVTANNEDSDKKREIALKAWFAWYLRKGDRFEEKKEGVDALEGMVKPTERDKREIEKERARSGGG